MPKAPPEKNGAVEAGSSGPALAPLATPRQVVAALDLGRRDPFSSVVNPRILAAPDAPRPGSAAAERSKLLPSLEAPKGLVFQGVMQGPGGIEALVQYTPENNKSEGVRSGSVQIGYRGTGLGDSLLPPGWGVHAIDGSRGWLVLRAGQQLVRMEL